MGGTIHERGGGGSRVGEKEAYEYQSREVVSNGQYYLLNDIHMADFTLTHS